MNGGKITALNISCMMMEFLWYFIQANAGGQINTHLDIEVFILVYYMSSSSSKRCYLLTSSAQFIILEYSKTLETYKVSQVKLRSIRIHHREALKCSWWCWQGPSSVKGTTRPSDLAACTCTYARTQSGKLSREQKMTNAVTPWPSDLQIGIFWTNFISQRSEIRADAISSSSFFTKRTLERPSRARCSCSCSKKP